ncbi:cathepsin-L cysteine peptidase, putative [Bodo saltans]|uniref:Cathepsin-L cysteine peptidase, putative n=1 Tax=Bodo saltans TaxID=75058 RepID=A0A0S4J918_BODSA|nr:cathepsin-L cysteine peptidase, putative [Bodo saltans]|eukprot:CUG86391.1 cathepsin-L cysteine peptidase, putative [Bodo saltans]
MMKKVVVLMAVVLAALGHDVQLHKEFQSFKAKYQKKYISHDEEMHALRAFGRNRELINEMRMSNPEAKFGQTRFSDMTQNEFMSKMLRSHAKPAAPVSPGQTTAVTSEGQALPKEINWVTRGAVSPVRDQGDCASDWAFAAVDNIEGVNFVKNGQLTLLSTEELLSCTNNGDACNGGITAAAFEWLLNKEGGNIMTAASWPGETGTSNCTFVGKTVGATISGYQSLGQSEALLQVATVNYGPIAVGVDALSWQFYESGVLTNCSASSIDHMVTVVGYNEEGSTPYWIVKNSWGTDFGLDGYIWIQKGVNACGIKEMAITAFAAKY